MTSAPTGHSPLDVLVVSFNRPDLLERCLRGIREFLPGEQVRIWDNQSPASPQIREMARKHPDIDWHFSGHGIGFAAGMNHLVAASTENTLLLNPDAVLLGPLAGSRAVLGEERVAAVSPLVVDPQGIEEPWDVAHRRQNVVRTLLNHAGYARQLRRTPFSDLYPQAPDEVGGYLTGCSLLVSRAAWRDVGPFDERYFLYGEDNDWARRALARGWRLRLVHEAEVSHGEAEAVHQPPAARSADLLAANTALVAGAGRNRGATSVVTAGQLILGRIQRSKRTVRAEHARIVADRAAGRPDVIFTTDSLRPGAERRSRVLLANELAARGYPVTMVCTEGLGVLERQLHHTVRLALRSWWQPVVDTVGDRCVLVSGNSRAELDLAAAWSRLGGRSRRRWLTWHATGSAEEGRVRAISHHSGVLVRSVDVDQPVHDVGRRFVLPPGIDPQPMRADPRPGRPVVAVVGRPGSRIVLDAAVRASGPAGVVLLGADGDTGSPAARTRPWTAWPAEAFDGILAVCLPELDDSTATVALEAMASGVAVVAPSRSPLAVLLGGGAGIPVRDDTEAGWGTALSVLGDPAAVAATGAVAARRATELYGMPAVVDRFENVVAEVLRRPPR